MPMAALQPHATFCLIMSIKPIERAFLSPQYPSLTHRQLGGGPEDNVSVHICHDDAPA